mgnify:CR=1 FL=1
MSTNRPTVGLDHLTVVPTNFDGDADTDDVDSDDDVDGNGNTADGYVADVEDA